MQSGMPLKLRHLLPENGSFYKANLHTHSTCSDGDCTVEEIKDAYRAHGYQIVAFTDHEVCLDHSDLTEESFLALTGYELSVVEPMESQYGSYARVCHLNFIAKEPHNRKQVFYHPDYVWRNATAYMDQVVHDGHRLRPYDTETLNAIIRAGGEAGFLVALNHPKWSLQTSEDYAGLEGLWGVEIINGISCREGFEENQPHVFEEMLRQGKPVFPLATDDCHDTHMFIGYVMIAAPKLEYAAVIRALEQGDFYASNGAEIHSLTLEGDTLRVTCTPCRQIRLLTERRWVLVANADGEPLTEAAFHLRGWFDGCMPGRAAYFRVSITDEQGRCAYTRAYSREELKDHFLG